MILGGIKIPRVLEAITVPVAKYGSYCFFSINGKPITPSMTTEAPIIPVLAAIMIPRAATETANPPRTRPNRRSSDSSKSFASPERSSIRPI